MRGCCESGSFCFRATNFDQRLALFLPDVVEDRLALVRRGPLQEALEAVDEEREKEQLGHR